VRDAGGTPDVGAHERCKERCREEGKWKDTDESDFWRVIQNIAKCNHPICDIQFVGALRNIPRAILKALENCRFEADKSGDKRGCEAETK
jgi:hypothetical protein